MPEDCNPDTTANELFTSLTTDAPVPPTIDFTDPDFTFNKDETSDLYADVDSVTLEQLTDTDIEGEGVFDVLMKAVDNHINREFRDNRITADKYATVYTEALNTVLGTATTFLLQKDQARWQAITAQMEARIAEIKATEALIGLEKAKAETAKMIFDMKNSGAQYALTKMQTANAGEEFCLIKTKADKELYELEELFPITKAQEAHKLDFTLPNQSALILEQVETARAQTMDTRIDGLVPVGGVIGLQKESIEVDITSKNKDIDVKDKDIEGRTKDIALKDYSLVNTLPAQVALINEQLEAERAKTKDTRTDSSSVEGSIGKQKELYDQQIDSFDKDAKYKVAKMHLDAWITQKTLDEGLTAPTALQNTNIGNVLTTIKNLNNL